MPASDDLQTIQSSGTDTVYFIKGGDGLWSVHVRDPAGGAAPYRVTKAKSLTAAVRAAAEHVEPDDIEDLI